MAAAVADAPPARGSASAHSDVPVAPPPPPPSGPAGPARPAASPAADTAFATTPLAGSFLGGAFEGKHAIGYPSADKTFTVAVWDVPVTCAARRPQGRFVKIVFPRREKAPRQKLGMNGILVGDEGPSAREAGISQGVFAELLTAPKGAKQGEARLVADFDAPEFKVSVKLNGTTTFAVCKCTEKDCL